MQRIARLDANETHSRTVSRRTRGGAAGDRPGAPVSRARPAAPRAVGGAPPRPRGLPRGRPWRRPPDRLPGDGVPRPGRRGSHGRALVRQLRPGRAARGRHGDRGARACGRCARSGSDGRARDRTHPAGLRLQPEQPDRRNARPRGGRGAAGRAPDDGPGRARRGVRGVRPTPRTTPMEPHSYGRIRTSSCCARSRSCSASPA